ncbi:MAG: NAD(+)/NADH kinase [Clostridiales bacterium]|nr:NAD(+)/NADH kinase [Clostridiales bacterium]
MRFGIHSNDTRDIGYKVAADLCRLLLDRGSVPVFEPEYKDTTLSDIEGVEFGLFDDCDMILSIGGDGTFLSLIDTYRDLGLPFVAVNKGSIGFLTEMTEFTMEDGIDRILDGRYTIVSRMQLECELYDKDGNLKSKDICLNDCSVLRGSKPHIVKLSLFIDGERVENFYGDGLVVATPTGSTAYTLAAGGPLLMPTMNVMLVTPICSHTLQNTSYVIGPDSEVEIKLGDFESVPIICPDGREFNDLAQYDSLKIKRSEQVIKTVNLGVAGFFQNVRRKIVARGSFYENSKE